jgi:hypothetical protein
LSWLSPSSSAPGAGLSHRAQPFASNGTVVRAGPRHLGPQIGPVGDRVAVVVKCNGDCLLPD